MRRLGLFFVLLVLAVILGGSFASAVSSAVFYWTV